MEIWKIIAIGFVIFLFVIKLIFQVQIDFAGGNMIVFYYSLNKKRRMSFVI